MDLDDGTVVAAVVVDPVPVALSNRHVTHPFCGLLPCTKPQRMI